QVATNNSKLTIKPTGFNQPQDAELPAYISAQGGLYRFGQTVNKKVQELFDNTGVWRQARVDLGDFAGRENLQIRFDFSTAGSMDEEGLEGDRFGSFQTFTTSPRGQNNNFEGVYIDNVIVGFAERGEMVTNLSGPNSSYFSTPPNPDPAEVKDVEKGPYQLEIRRGTEYGITRDPLKPNLTLVQTLDTNDRQAGGITLLAPSAAPITQTITQQGVDAFNEMVFDFDLPPASTGSATLSLTVSGDFGDIDKFLTVQDRTLQVIGNVAFLVDGDIVDTDLFVTSGADGAQATATINLTLAQLDAMNDDGHLTIVATPSFGVELLGNSFVTMTMTYLPVA